MDDIIKILPLPLEIVYKIASYDRILAIKKLPKTDERYNLLRTIPLKQITYDQLGDILGIKTIFTNSHKILSITLLEKELLVTYLNIDNDNECAVFIYE